jgi:putative endonuclease
MYEPWFVYLLRCSDGTLYCGVTNNVDKRLAAHGRGRVKYTRGRLPVAIAHLETADGKGAALRAEAAWKRLTRKQKLARMAAVRSASCVFGAATLSDKDAKALPRAARRRRRRV